MQLDKLQLDLRPRPNAQALDLGLVLLRSHLPDIYKAWLALWLPLVALCSGLAWLSPQHSGMWWLLAWWLRPLLERAPLYILSRQVFGETVSWQDALRAWPQQLRGGWFRLLTWWRPCVPGRGLYQAIWQLEGARGAVAAERRKVIGGNKTARSAFWFGTMCAHFELILQIGLIAFIGIFLSHENAINPFAYLLDNSKQVSLLTVAAMFTAYAFAVGIIGPIYTACCFTLYLNRRATLEAWDIEIMLRQIAPPAGNKPRASTPVLILPLALAVALALCQPPHAEAGQAALPCTPPKWIATQMENQAKSHGPDQDAEQARLRREVADLFASEDLRGYVCEKSWERKKNPDQVEPQPLHSPSSKLPETDLSVAAKTIKALLIAAAIVLTAWLLYRYRDKLPGFTRAPAPRRATEIRGLDIRPETLPDDVAAAIRKLWEQGQRRAALALLYRATLSRLVHEDGLPLTHGATEGDCLRLAKQAHAERKLNAAKLRLATIATELWQNGAYGNRWPNGEAVAAHCAQWQAHFGKAAVAEQVQA